MKNFIKEFKEFISRGNVLDMAIGVVIATAFGKITTSLVANLIPPLIAAIFNSPGTDALNIVLRPAVVDAAGEVTKEAIVLGLGTFIGTIVDFIIIALVIFAIIKAFNKARAAAEAKKKAAEEAAAAEPEEPKPTAEELLAQILETIKKQ